MGAYLSKPVRSKAQEKGEGNGLKFGMTSMQGWRENMEDSHVAKINLGNTHSEWSYFAVFDGHAGDTASHYCAEHLLDTILQSNFPYDGKDAIRAGCIKLDNKLNEMLSDQQDRSGSTAVFTFISNKLQYIANLGDSRAVLCNSGRPIFSTSDHTADVPTEQERITNAGGHVSYGRVNGNLAVSRALGDVHYKKNKGKEPMHQLVSSEPEIFIRERNPSDEFLILACDGLWDVMSNEEMCAYIHSRLLVTDDLEDITSQVVDTCLYKGSKDNMTIVLIVYPGAPAPSPEAITADKELDEVISKRIKELLEQNMDIDFGSILNDLKIHIPQKDLPPGGGFEAKRAVIDNIFKELCPYVCLEKRGYFEKTTPFFN